ncbi:MAG: DUF4386 domain-containing protein [Ferruginibacter sp.]
MKIEKTIGYLLITGAIGVFIPYTILTITFEYPGILRHDAGTVLTKFHDGGPALIFTWWAFAILGLPLLIAYILIGQKLENKFSFIKWVTTVGIISGIVQIIGLLRWVFVVPLIANNYLTAGDVASKEAAKISFLVVHQFGGVLLGEHIGQLFTIAWTIMVSYAFIKLRLFPKWVNWLGIGASVIYLLAQAELFATVIPEFPVWEMAGFIGSTLWLLWLIITGVFFTRIKNKVMSNIFALRPLHTFSFMRRDD